MCVHPRAMLSHTLFSHLQVQEEVNSPATFSNLAFSNNGACLLGAVDGRVYVLDAFKGTPMCKFITCNSQENPPPMEASFSPDSKYIVAGESFMSVTGTCSCKPAESTLIVLT